MDPEADASGSGSLGRGGGEADASSTVACFDMLVVVDGLQARHPTKVKPNTWIKLPQRGIAENSVVYITLT